tara:strand:- start:466 stop:675 length:210 start_codon:yes stop_codon:yes gene_type:complete
MQRVAGTGDAKVMDIMEIVGYVTMIVTVASLVAASTPTPKDDVWIGKLYKMIDLLAINVGKAKEKPVIK